MVAELLREAGALLEGHFVLSSGNHAGQYVQCARLLEDPRRAERVCRLLAERIRLSESESGSGSGPGLRSGSEIERPSLSDTDGAARPKIAVDSVIGPAIGGILVAYELARALGVRALFTERVEGGMSLRRGFALRSGERVWIAEDVVTTGRSSLEVADVVAAAGGEVAGIACIVDRSPETTALPFPIVSALKMSIEIFSPEACPLCALGRPVVKPGSRPEISV
ncbi:orotate phosphoribosyltransferase [Candidatus Bipolaricaulota bacterium]|nr:orotate phosphoribosyltransferase [Candidatus Bipolaricaulota bacterium]